MTTRPLTVKPQQFSLDLKYTQTEGTIYLSGTHALVRIPLDQHRADRRRGLNTATFISGYPGSPLGGLDLELKRQERLLHEHHATFVPAVNEDVAATAMHGSQTLHRFPAPKYDGVLGLWFGKGPGVDRTGDAFRHGNLFGIGKNGGVLALAGDDPMSKSSTIPSDSSVALYGVVMPILYPGNVQEILDLGQHGFALSRASGLWAALRIVTNVADGAGTAEVSPERIEPQIPSLEFEGQPFTPALDINSTGMALILETERKLHLARLELARRYAAENQLNRIVVPTPDAWLGIIAGGKNYYDTRQALAELGLDESALRHHGIRILKVGMTYPLERQIVREFARGLQEIVVIEDKRAFLELQVKDILYSQADRPTVVGKLDEHELPLLPINGELDSDIIARAIASRLSRKMTVDSAEDRIHLLDEVKRNQVAPTTMRLPHFCSGCPHNRSLAVPPGSIVGAGIGCHSLTIYMSPGLVGTNIGMTHMGGEGAQWVGLAPFTETPHIFQNMGDGTLFHSGSLAIRYAVHSGVNITYKILYNHVVAMTGGQDPSGGHPVPQLTRLLEAEGVRRIIVTADDPGSYRGARLAKIAEVWHRDRLVEAQALLATMSGVTVLLHDQQCATEKRRRRKRGLQPEPPRHVVIDERACEGCGDCGKKSNCLSIQPVETEFGRKTQINQTSCTKDYSCLLGDCPAFLTVEPGGLTAQKRRQAYPTDISLPDPVLKVPTEGFQLYMMGIGGTGVVTVNQILGTAALLDGKHVRALDQTGLAQKSGPVVSHLKILSAETEVANNLSAGGADLYLAFDLIVGMHPLHLAKTNPQRTIAVVSTSQIPTGKMVVDNAIQFPDVASCLDNIARGTRKDASFSLDAQALADALFGDDLAANNILLGAAYQVGAIPISAAAIEEAITLNGVAVDMNVAAFRWGRLAVVNPQLVENAVAKAASKEAAPSQPAAEAQPLIDLVAATGELRRLLEIRIPELIAYQDAKYARQYAVFVAKVKRLEEEKSPGSSGITEAVARSLFKLMAYKDEYEVARLHLDPALQARLKARFGDKAKVGWELQPPTLRDRGLKRKTRFGAWFTRGMKALRAMKRFRGTSLDLFGKSELRRTERALIDEYRQMMETALDKLTAQTYGAVLALAALPEDIRGYDQIKLASVEQYRNKAEQLLASLDQQ